jgi:large subunit ribosomal protein L33
LRREGDSVGERGFLRENRAPGRGLPVFTGILYLPAGPDKGLFMASKKTAVELVALQCSECKRKNYTTKKNRRNIQEKLEFNKYCPFDRKHTLHKETKIK